MFHFSLCHFSLPALLAEEEICWLQMTEKKKALQEKIHIFAITKWKERESKVVPFAPDLAEEMRFFVVAAGPVFLSFSFFLSLFLNDLFQSLDSSKSSFSLYFLLNESL